MASLDGMYKISIPTEEEDFGPPTEEEDLDTIELEEVGEVQISGNKVINLDPSNDHISELLQSTFRREGKKVKDMYVDSQIPVKNNTPGFPQAFLDMLELFDYVVEKQD